MAAKKKSTSKPQAQGTVAARHQAEELRQAAARAERDRLIAEAKS